MCPGLNYERYSHYKELACVGGKKEDRAWRRFTYQADLFVIRFQMTVRLVILLFGILSSAKIDNETNLESVVAAVSWSVENLWAVGPANSVRVPPL